MNIIEREMVEVLTTLRDEYGVFEIKAEFEAEGSRIEEMMRLKDVTSKVNLPIILKIGGVEAITDIFNGLSIGVKGIIAPMAETPFAVSKFLNSIEIFVAKDNREDIDFAINIETQTAYDNLDKIFALEKLPLLYGITIGRVDMVGSMGYDRSQADGEKITSMCRTIFQKARDKNLNTGLGGAISTGSIPVIQSLLNEDLIDKYETRKVVFKADSVHKNPEAGILKAIEFELLWLKSKRRYYSGIKAEDDQRIEMLEKRLGQK
jgi:4-hydroxy-2-oxoheptanedioate aldolase